MDVRQPLSRHHIHGVERVGAWREANAPAAVDAIHERRLEELQERHRKRALAAPVRLRDRFSAADSLYVALAIRAGEPLLTSDMRLARAATHTGIEVRTLA
jgi:hypothetical protein